MKKYPMIFTASAAMCACLVCGVAFGVTANADEVWNADGTELAETYRIGETVSLPDYTLEYNGKTAAAERSLHFPDGTATHEKEVELSKAGDYTVYYNAVIDGKVFSRSLAFTADYKSYYFTGANSVATYGAYTEYGCSSTGLQVRLGNGESLIFTRFVDVESLTKDDMIIQGFITPDQRGGADFDKLTVTLTDAKDPSVYLRFDLNRWTGNDSGKGYTFVSAGTGRIWSATRTRGATASCTSTIMSVLPPSIPGRRRGARRGAWRELTTISSPIRISSTCVSTPPKCGRT